MVVLWATRGKSRTLSSDTRYASKVSWSMLVESPKGSKNPVGAITPSSFSYPIWTAEVRAALLAGAKAAAELMRAATTVNFILAVLTDSNCELLRHAAHEVFRRRKELFQLQPQPQLARIWISKNFYRRNFVALYLQLSDTKFFVEMYFCLLWGAGLHRSSTGVQLCRTCIRNLLLMGALDTDIVVLHCLYDSRLATLERGPW